MNSWERGTGKRSRGRSRIFTMSTTCSFIACSPAASEFVSSRTLDDTRYTYPSEPARKEFWHPSFETSCFCPPRESRCLSQCSSTPHSLQMSQSCSCRQFSDIPRNSRHIKLMQTPWGLPPSSFFVKVATTVCHSRWLASGKLFTLYLRQHALILAPYLHEWHETAEQLNHVVMLPVR